MDFTFQFAVKYSAEVEELLYNVETFDLNLPEHSIQAKHGRTVCLLCCSDLLVNETSLKNHFSSEEHRRNLSRAAFDAYHRTFLDLPEPQQLTQKDFMPKTADHVYCEICNRKVLLKNVANHTHKTLESSDSFDYSRLTVKDIKQELLQDYVSLDHPLIFHRVGKALICLLCPSVVEETAEEHLIRTEQHKDASQRLTSLRDYHWKWLQEDEQFHIYRVWTIPIKKKLSCILCNRSYAVFNMIRHIQDFPCRFLPDDHLLMTDSSWMKSQMQKFFEEHLMFPMAYNDDICEIFYPPRITSQLLVLQEFSIYTIQRNLQDTKCLVCFKLLTDTFLLSDIVQHVESEEHQNNLRLKINLLCLESYHKFWMVQELKIQIKQFNFMPCMVTPMLCQTCLLCNKPVKLEEIINHVGIDCAKIVVEKKGEAIVENGSVKDVKAIVGSSEENSIHQKKTAKIAPVDNYEGVVNGMDALMISEQTNPAEELPILMKISNISSFCVCCGIYISGSPKKHLVAKGHQKNLKLPPNYKNFETTQKAMDIITRIPNFFSFFSIKSIHHAVCMACLKDINFTNIEEHTRVCENWNCVVSNQKFENITTVNGTDSKSMENLRKNFNTKFPETAMKSANSLVNLRSPKATNKKSPNKSVEKLNLSLSEHTKQTQTKKILDFDNISLPELQPSSSSSSSASPPSTTDNRMYDSQLIADLYPTNDKKKVPQFHKLFIQKRGNFEMICLYCMVPVAGCIDIHINGRKHAKHYTNDSIREVLECYHSYWVDQILARQYDQIKFNPHTNTSVSCKSCYKILDFSCISDHVCNNQHKTIKVDKVPEVFRSIKVMYHPLVMAKFYSRTMMETIDYVLKTTLPVSRHWQGRIVCLLCGKSMLRDNTLLAKHLIKFHCPENENDSEKLSRQLEMLVKYHMFWQGHKSEEQLFQIYFLLDTLEALKCSNNHVVPYSDVHAHIYTCQFEGLPKLEHAFAKLLNASDENSNNSECDRAENLIRTSSSETFLSFSESEGKAVEETKKNKKRRKKKGKAKVKKGKENLPENMAPFNVKHNVVPSVKYPKSQNLLDLVPARLEVHLKYIAVHQDCLVCSACNETIPKRAVDLIHHISSRQHSSVTKITTTQRYSYQCDICVQTAPTEFDWQAHLDTVKHCKNYSEIGPVRKTMVNEYECAPCHFVVFGDKISVVRHEGKFEADRNFDKNRNGIGLLPSIKKLFSSEIECARGLKPLMEECEKLKDDTGIKKCIEAVESSLRKVYPDCVGYPFGSRISGLGTTYSDLDLFVDIGGTYNGSGSMMQAIFRKAKKNFLADPMFSSIHPIDSARTPIIKLVHIQSDIDCDISFVNGLSVENTKYIKFCLEMQPQARPAMILLKTWSNRLKNESITSYSLCMMFLFQLQMQGYAIPVHKLRELTTTDVMVIDGWHTITYNKPMEVLRKHVKIYKKEPFYLVREFFKAYSTFNFRTQCVCPLLGTPVPLSKFLTDEKTGSALPDEMITYKNKLGTDPENLFRATADMCVQDPFDLSHNLTKCVKKADVRRFQKFCALTLEVMQ